jgi:hypothetical protein
MFTRSSRRWRQRSWDFAYAGVPIAILRRISGQLFAALRSQHYDSRLANRLMGNTRTIESRYDALEPRSASSADKRLMKSRLMYFELPDRIVT